MCLQCRTEAVLFTKRKDTGQEEEIFPGWALVQATKGHFVEMSKGDWGLLLSDAPTIIWAGELIKEPDDDAPEEQHDRYYCALTNLRDAMYIPSIEGYYLVKSCMAKGFDPEGENPFHMWLLDYIVDWVDTHDSSPHDLVMRVEV